MIDPNNKLIYRERKYKYQVLRDYVTTIDLIGYSIETQYFRLIWTGELTVKCLYAWDGPSGPTKDDSTNLVPSLIHDVGYQAIRLCLLPLSCKTFFDDLLASMMRERGASDFRAELYHAGVSLFGGSACIPGSDNDDVMEAV